MEKIFTEIKNSVEKVYGSNPKFVYDRSLIWSPAHPNNDMDAFIIITEKTGNLVRYRVIKTTT